MSSSGKTGYAHDLMREGISTSRAGKATLANYYPKMMHPEVHFKLVSPCIKGVCNRLAHRLVDNQLIGVI
jgi:hypothetical protein